MVTHLPIRFDQDESGAVFVTYEIPDDAPAAVREGLARRALVMRGECCPCGARLDVPLARPGEVVSIEVEHQLGCPAITETLRAAIRQWKAGAA